MTGSYRNIECLLDEQQDKNRKEHKGNMVNGTETGKITAICISENRGTQKKPVQSAHLIQDWGIENDAHAGRWHRQVSLLAQEEIDAFKAEGADVYPGAFGENISVEGIALTSLPVGTRLQCNTALLEITQIGKDCHSHCTIYYQMGKCIMPTNGIFARVLQEGEIQVGDEIRVVPVTEKQPFRAAVITLSDKGAAGEREDKSGPLAEKLLTEAGYDVVEYLLLPDEKEQLEKELKRLADQRQVHVIFTTGGTGFSPRDITPEATIAVCDRMASGIAEAIRGYSLSITPRAMFSRAVSGLRGSTLIINLPGSPKAVQEALEYLLPHLEHGISVLRGNGSECARK